MPASKSSEPPTVKDIAREAGMSPSTVSAVLTNRIVERRISQKTADKILGIARSMGYVPNLEARSLRNSTSGKRQIFLSILSSYEAPLLLVSEALRALQAVADREKKAEIVVRIEMFPAGHLKEMRGLIEGSRTNGAIVGNTVAADDRFLANTVLPFPVVLLGRHIGDYPSVSENSAEVGEKAAEILHAVGRNQLAVIRPHLLTQSTESRLRAFIQRARELTGKEPKQIISTALSATGGSEAMRTFMRRDGVCDGLFSLTDTLVMGAYQAMKASGKSIPRDIAVVGIGDDEVGPYLEPPLTGFAATQEGMHQTAAEMLKDLVYGKKLSSKKIEIPVTPVLRSSTGHCEHGELRKITNR